MDVLRALTTKVRGPQFNPGWLPVFHGSLKNILKPFLMYTGLPVHYIHVHVWAPNVQYIHKGLTMYTTYRAHR